MSALAPAADDPNDAGSPDAGHDIVAAEAAQLLGHESRRAVDLVEQFRVGMQIVDASL